MKTIDVIRTYHEGNQIAETYAVNDAYEGLFKESDGEYCQIMGTCQFYAMTPKQFIQNLRKRLMPGESMIMIRNSAKGFKK